MKKAHLVSSILILATLVLGGCASTRVFNTEGVDMGLTPKRAAMDSQAYQGKTVLWGGVIIASANMKESTQVEILAYPLDAYQRPMSDEQALGRFLAVKPGYLETTDYAPGRFVTVKGTLGTARTGRVGESDYVYPVVNVSQQNLWPREGEYVEPRVRFGIGVMIRN